MTTDNVIHRKYSFKTAENPEQVDKKLFITGIVTSCLGLAAIILPLIATLTIEMIAAIVLLSAGSLHLIYTFKSKQLKERFFRIASSLLYLVTGAILLAFPLKGALTLTIIIALLFIIGGVFKISISLALRQIYGWKWILLNGLLSLFLGVFIWLALPQAASWVIGLLIGIELFLSGWTMIICSFLTVKTQILDTSIK